MSSLQRERLTVSKPFHLHGENILFCWAFMEGHGAVTGEVYTHLLHIVSASSLKFDILKCCQRSTISK
jgi:hypothetical protein